MLEEYIPDDAPDYFHGEYYGGTSPNPLEYIKQIIGPEVITGSFSLASGSYYKPIGDPIERPAVLAGKTIVDGIEWSNLPDDHKYHRTADLNADERPYIKVYSRIRGILSHSLALDDGVAFEDAVEQALDDIDNVPSDMSHHDLYDAVADWDGAPEVKPTEQEHVYDVPRPALDQRIQDEAHAAASNWSEIEYDIRLRSLADEIVTLGETCDGHAFGCKLDRLGYITDTESPLPPGVYITDIKTGDRWHPAHLAQTEAYRRSLFPDLAAEPYGLVVRLGPKRGDYTVLTSHDDEWDEAELWRLFKKKARWMYEDEKSHYPTALEYVDPR